jgi:hypothetical protein
MESTFFNKEGRMEERRRYEKEEKEEKDVAKHEEKSYDEKWRRDPIGAISWAVFLIWAGVILLLYNLDQIDVFTDFLDRLNLPLTELPFDLPFVDERAWQVFFLGAGIIVLLEIIVRLLMPAYRRPIVGSIIWAGILFGLALGNWEIVGPAIVIGIGIVIIFGGFMRRR